VPSLVQIREPVITIDAHARPLVINNIKTNIINSFIMYIFLTNTESSWIFHDFFFDYVCGSYREKLLKEDSDITILAHIILEIDAKWLFILKTFKYACMLEIQQYG